MEKNLEDKNTLQFAIVSRIKLLYRPTGLALPPEKAPTALVFSRSGQSLNITNSSPYYVTVTNIISNKKELKSFMVSPMGKTSISIPEGSNNTISYQTINDFGALTPAIQINVK